MTGNMTGGTVTGGNMTGSISSFDESESDGGTVSDESEGGCIDCLTYATTSSSHFSSSVSLLIV
jgi:hypothetical protein